MVLVIPMSGIGKRFNDVGYGRPKPLIIVDGRPIIAHVLDMYPGEEDPIFICNEEHLATTDILDVLRSLKPDARIVPTRLGDLKGPVPAVKEAYGLIPDEKEVMISYCDFTGKWDYGEFKRSVRERGVDGAIPAYIGFHPHLLGPGFYGHMRWDDEKFMLEIKEKSSFTEDKMQEYGAVGSYWFKNGALMKKYFDEAIEKNLRTGNEFFCSMPYNLLVRDGLKVLIQEMERFCQWGTPEDLEEYEAWSRAFAYLSGKPGEKGFTEIPRSREEHVKRRETSLENLAKTFSYWHNYFRGVEWHPYR